MSTTAILFTLSVICIIFGLLKLVAPERFLAMRTRFPWLSKLSLYSSLYEGPKAKTVVKINGLALLVIGAAVLISVLAKQ